MNLTLSLAINGGTGTGTCKKRKVRDSVIVIDDVIDGDGGDRSKVMRLVHARERMVARLELDDHRRTTASDDDADAGSGGGLRLMHLLLSSVASAEAGNVRAATAALHEVYRRASFRGGDPAPRVAAHFADALAASRLLRSPVTAASPAPAPARAEQSFLAYTMFYQASPLHQFAHFAANQAIVEAFERGGRRRLHVVDFDVSYGFQWPSLIQSLSDAASTSGGEPAVSLQITGVGPSADELRQTGARLTRFASGCPNVRFEFDGVVTGPSSSGRHERIIKDDDGGGDATVVVNLAFPAASTTREAFSSTLARVRSLNPSLVFLVERGSGMSSSNGGGATSRGGRRFSSQLLPPFTACLRYFAAVFDSLHECMPADSAERLAIERDYLGVEIADAVASLLDHGGGGGGGGDDHRSMAEPCSSGSGSWKEMMECAGFEGVAMSSRTVSQAKLLLKMKSGGGGGFRVIEGEGGRVMSLGWRDSSLITTTAWRRRRRSISRTSS
ncbi:unnamed protein product [Urochloa decumbens]|uniref:Uncharacterized protein n=1 Tax=Urochloa decumbens TaxID=240449 RepID=A0ABC9CX83_9POAL